MAELEKQKKIAKAKKTTSEKKTLKKRTSKRLKVKLQSRTAALSKITITSKDERFKERWTALNSEVHTALNHWNDLTEKYSGQLSPEDQQLKHIKSLLKDLQIKLKAFND